MSRMLVRMRKPRKCPECGATPVASILFGYPMMNEKLEADIEAGRVALGGCIVEPGQPAWVCVRCGREIHRAFRREIGF